MQLVSRLFHHELSYDLKLLVWNRASCALFVVVCIVAFILQCPTHKNEAAEAVGLSVSLIELFAGVQEVTLTFRSAGLPAAALDLSVDRKVCDLLTPAGMACRANILKCLSACALLLMMPEHFCIS